MKKLELKYGCNPNQKPASITVNDGRDLPLEVLNGKPGYINFMDALNSWQLVKAGPSGTTTSSRRQTATTWSWPLPACACSTTKQGGQFP